MLGATACGDDESSKSPRRLDEDAFCDRFRRLEATGEADESGELDDAVLAELAALAAQAPTEELGDALEVLGDVAADLSELDEDDPDSFGAALAAALSPEFLESAEVVESFAVGTCGIDRDDMSIGFSEFDEGGGGDTGPTGGSGGSGGGGPTGSVFDDLDAGDLADEVRPAVEQFAPDSEGSGITIFPAGDGTTVEVQVFAPSSLDAVALCGALAAAVDAGTTDPSVTVEVSADGLVVASRPPGGTCAAT